MRYQHAKPRAYSRILRKHLGKPTYVTDEERWTHVRGYEAIWQRDEQIAHGFPAKHFDHVYSTGKNIRLTVNQACALARVSPSIIPDRLKHTVTVRCGGLVANDVSLSFAADVADGKVRPTRREYARRIKGSVITRPRRFNAHRRVRGKLPSRG